jgi:periplasmic divalent cation tolerance protein
MRSMKAEASLEFCFIYSTYPDSESAQVAARALLSHKLAACVNVYPPMTSFYHWQGKQTEEPEIAVFIKTRRNLVEKAIAALRPLHPYSTPCFLILPVEGGNSDYLAWAREQTQQATEV